MACLKSPSPRAWRVHVHIRQASPTGCALPKLREPDGQSHEQKVGVSALWQQRAVFRTGKLQDLQPKLLVSSGLRVHDAKSLHMRLVKFGPHHSTKHSHVDPSTMHKRCKKGFAQQDRAEPFNSNKIEPQSPSATTPHPQCPPPLDATKPQPKSYTPESLNPI